MGKQNELSIFERLSVGASAGAIGKSVVAPFQRIQIMYQVQPGKQLTFAHGWNTTATVLREEGVMALWRGNIANATRSAPTAAVKFFTQSAYYNLIVKKHKLLNNSAGQFVSGALSGVTTVASTYPFDLFRTKMAASTAYKGYLDCLRQTLKYGVRGLFHGMSAPIVGSIPHTGIAFWCFDYTKRALGVDSSDKAQKAPFRRATAGFIAGFCGQTVTYPFSTVRRRMQTSFEWKQKGLIGCFTATVKAEGVLGLYRAYSIHAFKGPVSAAIAFAINDIFKDYLYDYHDSKAAAEEAEMQS